MQFQYFLKNGKVLPVEQAAVSYFNIAYTYGFGVYESVRVRGGVPYFAKDHMERLLFSANVIELEHRFALDSIVLWIEELVKKLEAQECNLKIILVGGNAANDAELVILPLNPLFPDKKLYKKGAKAFSVEYERMYPQAKTLNMLPSYLAYRDAKKKNCYDALFIDSEGLVLEGSRTNFYTISGKDIFTAPDEKVVAGIARKVLLQVLKKNGYEVYFEAPRLLELQKYDGAFLTSTSSKVMSLTQIDDFEYGKVSDELQHIMKLYKDFLETSKGVL